MRHVKFKAIKFKDMINKKEPKSCINCNNNIYLGDGCYYCDVKHIYTVDCYEPVKTKACEKWTE